MTADLVTRFLETAGGKLAYDDTGGDGPLVLALPGMGDLRSEYRFQRPALQQAGFRLVTMDVRGFGESSAGWADYSAHAVAGDALALIAHLGAARAVILGNSFAAGAALWAAHDRPELVTGLVLLGPIVRDLPMSDADAQAVQRGLAGVEGVSFWIQYWNGLFPSRKPEDHDKVERALTRNLHEAGRMDALRTMLFLSKADTAAIVSECRAPALVVMGTRDPDFPDPRAEADWLAAAIHARTVIVEGAGHYPHAEMPDEVNPQLISFLTDLNWR